MTDTIDLKTIPLGKLPKPWRACILVVTSLLFAIITTVLLRFYADDSLNFFAFWSLFVLNLIGLAAGLYSVLGRSWLLKTKTIAAFGALLAIFAYASFTFNKTLPISDGWYITYARLVLSGKVPYRDFDFLFPPAYLYLITIVIAIFGSEVIVVRLLGVYVILLTVFLLYKIFERVCHPFVAAVASIAAVCFMQSNNSAILFYDYINVYNVLNFAGLYFIVRHYSVEDQKTWGKGLFNWNLTLAGVFIAVSALTRQSSGVIMLLFAVCAILFASIILHRKILFPFLSYVIGVAAGLFVIMFPVIVTGGLPGFVSQCFGAASAAKGGLDTILTGWIPRVITYEAVVGCAALCAAFFAVYLWQQKKDKQEYSIPPICFAFIIFAFVILVYSLFASPILDSIFLNFGARSTVNPLFIFATLAFVAAALILLFKAIKKREVPVHLSLMMIIAGYAAFTQFGSCTSASTSEGQGMLTVCLAFIAVPLCFQNTKFHPHVAVANSLLAVAFSLSSLSCSYYSIYEWWGLYQGSYAMQTSSADVKALRGIKMPDSNKYLYEGIVYHVKRDYQEGDQLYTFPQIPIFHNLLDIAPIDGLRAPIAWFDVSSQESLKQDYALINDLMPRFIVYADIPESAIGGHEYAFNHGQRSVQRDFLELFHRWTSSGLYHELCVYDANGGTGSPYYVRALEVDPNLAAVRKTWLEAGLGQAFDEMLDLRSHDVLFFDDSLFRAVPSEKWTDGLVGMDASVLESTEKVYQYVVSDCPECIFLSDAVLKDAKYENLRHILSSYSMASRPFGEGMMYSWDDDIRQLYYGHVDSKYLAYEDGWINRDYRQMNYVEGATKFEVMGYIPAAFEEAKIALCIDGTRVDLDVNCLPEGGLWTFECPLDPSFPFHAMTVKIIHKEYPVTTDERDLGSILSYTRFLA